MLLKNMFLSNWYSIRAEIIPIGRSLTITGYNGSGKTVLDDALTIVLFGQDLNRLNIAGDRKRSAAGAAHWLSGGRELRPGEVTSFIIFEIERGDGTLFHQGVQIHTGTTGSLRALWFSGEGGLDSIGAVSGKTTGPKDIRMEKRYDTKEEAFRDFFRQRGYRETFIRRKTALKDFRTLNSRIILNDKLDSSLSEFVRKSILPEPTVAERFQEQEDSLKELGDLTRELKEYREQREYLTKLCQSYAEYKTKKTYHLLAQKISGNVLDAKLKEAERNAAEACQEAAKKLAEEEQKAAVKEEEKNNLDRQRLMLERENTNVPEAEEALKKAHEEKTAALQKQERSRQAEEAVRDYLRIAGEEDTPFQKEKLKQLHEKSTSHYQQMFAEKQTELFSAEKVRRDAETHLASYQRQNNGITGAKPSGPQEDARVLCQKIKKALEQEGRTSVPKLLCDCVIGVKDQSWQYAIETLIGNDRFGIIVPPEDYRTACRIQGETDTRFGTVIHDVSKGDKKQSSGLINMLEITDPYAERFLEKNYGQYHLAETESEYMTYPFAVRKNGQIKTRRGSRKAGTGKKTVLWFGTAARKQEEEKLAGQVEEAVKKEQELKRETSRLQSLQRELDKAYLEAASALAFYDAKADRKAEMAEKAEANARSLLDILLSEEKEVQLQEKIQEIEVLLRKAEKEREALKISCVSLQEEQDRYRKEQERIAKKRASLHPEKASEDLTEQEREIFEKEFALFTDENGQKQHLASLEKETEAKKSVLEAVCFSMPKTVKDSLLDAPERLETEEDAAYYKDRLNQMDVSVEENDRKRLLELEETIRDRTGDLLRCMGEDFSEAEAMVEAYNRNIEQYDLAGKQYHLGKPKEIRSDKSFILETARDAATGRAPLTKEKIDEVNKALSAADEDGMKLFDYREYITTQVEYRLKEDQKTSWVKADEIQKGDSTGQQDTLRYFLRIAVMDFQVYTRDSLRLIITDETAKTSDDRNAENVVRMMEAMGMSFVITSVRREFANFTDSAFVCEMKDRKNIHIIRYAKQNTVREKDMKKYLSASE